MVITIEQASYKEEQQVVVREVIAHLRRLGLEVTTVPLDPDPDPAHNVVLRQMVGEGFPITINMK